MSCCLKIWVGKKAAIVVKAVKAGSVPEFESEPVWRQVEMYR